jgi:hypothetical protein
MPVDKPVNKAAASARMPVNEAIAKAIISAVILELGGKLGPLIDEAAASARMPIEEPINKSAARTWSLK